MRSAAFVDPDAPAGSALLAPPPEPETGRHAMPMSANSSNRYLIARSYQPFGTRGPDRSYRGRMKLLAVMVVALIACGKKNEGGGEGGGGTKGGETKLVASCDQRGMAGAPIKVCIEYMGSMWTKKEVQARCSAEGQSFLEGACPSDGVVLSCLQEGGKPMEAINRFYDDVEKAKKICATIGTPK